MAEIRRLTRFVRNYEKEFAMLMMGFTQQAAEDKRNAPESKASIAYRAFAKELMSYAEQNTPAQRGSIHVLPGGGDRRGG